MIDLGGTLWRRSGTLMGRGHGWELNEWVKCGTKYWMVRITNALLGFILPLCGGKQKSG